MFPHSHSFDPTYGYALNELLKVQAPEEPAGFTEFWRSTFEEAGRLPLNIQWRKTPSPEPALKLFEVEYDSLDGVRIGGWITAPVFSGPVERSVVVGHGYGGREAPDFDLPVSRAVAIFPCLRGFHRSAHPEIPHDGHQHVMHGLSSRETYSHRGCVADVWRAASVLEQLYPSAKEELFYHGVSFGGGIGAMALPWDNRFKRAHLDVPSFGNHPLRVTLPCVGSGQAIQALHARHPEILDVLRWFDAAIAARHIRIPVFVGAALFDPAVPPPGQFAIYNAAAGEKRLFVRQAAHFEWPGQNVEDGQIHQALREWFGG